jgi:hypothetical protein
MPALVPFIGDLRISLPNPAELIIGGDAGPGARFQIELEFDWPSGTEGRFGGWRMEEVDPVLPMGAESNPDVGAGDKGL